MSIKIDVIRCQRCGENHFALAFEPLANPADDYAHWALCPTTQQPVLLMIADTSAKRGRSITLHGVSVKISSVKSLPREMDFLS